MFKELFLAILGAAQVAPSCVCDTVPGEEYLYLSPTHILHLPSFERITCDQNYFGEPKDASAGIVKYGGADRILICGGSNDEGCHVLFEGGWQQINLAFHRSGAASSPHGPDSWMVSGGSGDEQLATTEIYNSADATWTAGPELPHPSSSHCQVFANNQVFISGGRWRYGDGSVTLNSVLVLEDDHWTKLVDMPTRRYDHACVAWRGMILNIGGLDDNRDILSTVDMFNPAVSMNTWVAGPELPIQLYSAQAITVGEDLYVFGGERSTVFPFFNTDVYTLSSDGKWTALRDVSVSDYRSIYPALKVTSEMLHCTL